MGLSEGRDSQYFANDTHSSESQQLIRLMSITIKQSKQPEVIKLHNIDNSYRNYLTQKFLLATQSLGVLRVLPFSTVRKYEGLFRLINDIIYNYITIVQVRKTFGEEYTYLNYYNNHDYEFQGTPLTREKRLLLFILQTFGFQILKILFRRLYTEILEDCKTNHQSKPWKILVSFFPEFDDLVDRLRKLVLMVFLIKGDYFNLIQRLLNIRFIYMRHFKQTTINYKKEGYLILVQNIVQLAATLNAAYSLAGIQKLKAKSLKNSVPEFLAKTNDKEEAPCIICSEEIRDKAVTPCGHVFCWHCIVRATEIKPQCPNCRNKCLPSRVIQLRNY